MAKPFDPDEFMKTQGQPVKGGFDPDVFMAQQGNAPAAPAKPPSEYANVKAPLLEMPKDLIKGAVKSAGRTAYDTMTGFMNPVGAPLKALAERTGIDKRIQGLTEPTNRIQRLGGYIPDVAMAVAPAEEGISIANRIIPRTARAVSNFEKAATVANKLPVDVSHFAQPALRAERINRVAGDPMAPVVQKALERLGPTTEPLTYEDARTMASSAGRKAQQKAMGGTLTGEMGHRLKEVGRGLDVATSETAHKAGVGPIHDEAMREYAAAQRNKGIAKTALKIGVPTAIGTGLGYKALKGFGYLGD